MDTTTAASVLGVGMLMGAASALSGGLLVVAIIAALAPLMMSLMARSFVSSAVSLMLLVGVFSTALGPTVAHEILSAILYLTALLSASVTLAGYRIEMKVDALQRLPPKPPEPPAA